MRRHIKLWYYQNGNPIYKCFCGATGRSASFAQCYSQSTNCETFQRQLAEIIEHRGTPDPLTAIAKAAGELVD